MEKLICCICKKEIKLYSEYREEYGYEWINIIKKNDDQPDVVVHVNCISNYDEVLELRDKYN